MVTKHQGDPNTPSKKNPKIPGTLYEGLWRAFKNVKKRHKTILGHFCKMMKVKILLADLARHFKVLKTKRKRKPFLRRAFFPKMCSIIAHKTFFLGRMAFPCLRGEVPTLFCCQRPLHQRCSNPERYRTPGKFPRIPERNTMGERGASIVGAWCVLLPGVCSGQLRQSWMQGAMPVRRVETSKSPAPHEEVSISLHL